MDIPFLGSIDFDTGFEEALGDPDRLDKNRFLRTSWDISRRALFAKGAKKKR